MGKFDAFLDDAAPAANLNLRFGVDASPDEAAEAAKLARRYRLPVGVVSEFREDYRKKAQVDDARAVVDAAPKLKDWLAADGNHAKMAHDDVGTLGGIESTIKAMPTQIARGVRALAAGFGPQFGAGAYGAAAYPFEALGIDSVGGFLRNEQRAAQAVAERVAGPMSPDAGVLERGILSGLRSAGQTAATLPVGLAGATNAMLATMGGLTFGQTYGKARDQGASVMKSGFYALEDATAEVVTEKFLGAAKLIGDAKAGMGAAKLFVRDIAREIPGEMGATLWQNFNEWANLNPEKSVGEWVAEQPEALAETIIATIAGGGAQVGAIKAMQKTAERFDGQAQQAQKAEEAAAQMEQLAKLGEASKLKGRDAQTFREFVAQAAGEDGDAPTEMFIDHAVLANTLNQSGMTIEELAAVAPVVAEQLQAADTGGQVRIPVSEFMSAGEALTAPLIDHLRIGEDAMTRAEAKDYLKTQGDAIRADVETELQKQGDQAAFRDSIESVRAEFEGELNRAGRFTGNVNKAYAELLANFYGAQASRMGMTPQALLDKYKLRVQADVGQGARTLNQPAPQSLEDVLKAWDADGVVSTVHEKDGRISLDRIVAPARGEGIGTKAMQTLAQYADATGQTIELSPSTDFGASSRSRLVKFYKRFGFKENKGRSKDFTTQAGMVREPVKTLNQGEQAPRAQLSFGADITASPSVISLLAGADLSSFIHESSHFFLEVQSDLAARIQAQIDEGASVTDLERGIVADMNRLLEWFGVKGDERHTPLQAWGDMTLDEKREHHEKFARGFEAFTYEGKAPSMDLQPIFSRFRAWLADVYKVLLKAARGDFGEALKVKLNDDVRAVMGRMLATDVAIEEAEAARNMGPLFKTAADGERIGMTLAEYNAIQGLGQEAKDKAISELQTRGMRDMRWLGRARDKALKARQQEVEEQRREIRQEVRSEVYREPVYRAWQFLTGRAETDATAVGDKTGKSAALDLTTDNLFTAIAKMGGLRRDEVTKAWGVDPKDKLESGVFGKPVVRKEGGLSLDAMLDRLVEAGYILPDENGRGDPARFEKLFDAQRRGADQFSIDKDYAGEAPVEALPAEKAAGKLNTEALRQQYGTSETALWRKLSALRMTSDKGISPDVVAETFGFDSADALVKSLAEAMPPREVIEARTDQRMLEMFGDITSPEALSRAADEAVHNEARARFIATEMKALEAANTVREKRGKSSVNVLARAAKDYAQQVVARLKVRDIRPNQYATAEARNARLAKKAFAAGKTDEAAMHKRNQLVNNYATRAAYDAQEEVKSAQKYFRKFDKRVKALDPAYQEQIDGLLERFDFKPASLKEIDKRKSLAKWYADQVAADEPVPSLPDKLLYAAGKQSYKDMTVDEIRGLRETVEQLEHMGRLKNQLLLAKDKRDFDAIKAELISTIIASKGGERRPYKLETAPKTAGETLAEFLTDHRKLSSLIREMDGLRDDGPMYMAIGRSMNTRDAWENERQQRATAKILALYEPLLAMPGGMTGDASKKKIDEIGVSMTRGGRMSVALNWGNLDGRARLMSGNLAEGAENWTEGQIQAVMRSLSAKELEVINDVWRTLDEYWPEISDKHYRMNGVRLEKVDAVPFTLRSSDGVDVAMRGGYHPLKYDSGESPGIGAKTAQEEAKAMMRGAATMATTKRGHEQARVEGVKMKLRLDLNVVTEHIQDVIHDLAWHEWLVDANRIFRDKEILQTLSDYYGKDVIANIKGALEAIAGGDKVVRDSTTRLALRARTNISRAVMALSINTAFLQPFGLFNSMPKHGVGNVLRAVGQWVGTPAHMGKTLEDIKAKSPMMRNRANTMNRELYEISAAINGKSKAMRVTDGALFFLTTKMQMIADVPTWLAVYNKTLRQNPADEQLAIDQADRAVIESQGGGSIKDLAKVQRDHPFLTQFMSYFSATYQGVVESTKGTDFKSPAAVAGWLADMALYALLPAILPSLLMHFMRGGGDDEPEEMAKKMATWQIQYLLAPIVYAREVGGVVPALFGERSFDYAGPPAARVIVDLYKFTKQAAQGEVDEAAVLAAANLAASLTGLPAAQFIRSYKGWKAWDEGEEGAGPQSVLFGPPPKP